MTTQNPKEEIRDISERLLTERPDALATYLDLRQLYGLVEEYPGQICFETVFALNKKLKERYLAARRLQYLTYRETAKVMSSIIVNTEDRPLAEQFMHTLKTIIKMSKGSQRRGVAEVLGSLPVSVDGPEMKGGCAIDIPVVKWNDILKENKCHLETVWETAGRSIIFRLDKKGLLVVKFALGDDSSQFMQNEAWWMNYLASRTELFEKRFDIPIPLKVKNGYLFYIEDLSKVFRDQMGLHAEKYRAFAYRVHRDYFVYPNDHRENRKIKPEGFREVMFRNAWLLGKLASHGIIHAAPIPLFHNRVQRNRRPDNGLYEWQKGGRLDRWLHSCRYPNFGLSGVRDFEHLVSIKNSGLGLYKNIGTHFLSLILVTCSYFRNIDPNRLGRDEQGAPVDATDLFDKTFLSELIQGIFLNYCSGFSGVVTKDDMPADFQNLVSRIIQEMGVDHHMDEMLRIADQKAMNDRVFKEFLTSNQYTKEDVARLKKGKEDLAIMTGPHLGEFGREISIPELTEFLEVASATCVMGKYLHDNELNFPNPKHQPQLLGKMAQSVII